MNSKQYANLRDLVRQVSDDPKVASELEAQIDRRRIVKKLLAFRAAKGLSQAQVAEKMKCSQSCISKLENGDDDDLKLGEFHSYLRAIGMDVRLVLSSAEDLTSANSIKFHAMAIKRELEALTDIAKDDESLAVPIAQLFGETVFNVIRFVQAAAVRLPKSKESGRPFLDIGMVEIDDVTEFDTCFAPPTIPRPFIAQRAL